MRPPVAPLWVPLRAPARSSAPFLPPRLLFVQLGAAAEFECAGLGLAEPLAGMAVLLWWPPPHAEEPGHGRGEDVRVTARPAVRTFPGVAPSFSIWEGHSPVCS